MSETQPETQPEPEQPDTPDVEPAPEPEPEPELDPDEPEPEQPAEDRPPAPTPEEIEKRATASYKSFETYAKRVFTLFADEAHDLAECPLCPSQHKGFLNVHDAGRVPEEVKQATMQFLGFAREVDYPHSSQHRTCQECDGYGKVTTGSRVPGKETIGCAACHGAGFIGPQAAPANGHAEVDPALSGPTLYGLDTPKDEVDEWNEPRILPDGRENPNYGKMPHRKIQVEPWGTTAGLTAQDAVTG